MTSSQKDLLVSFPKLVLLFTVLFHISCFPVLHKPKYLNLIQFSPVWHYLRYFIDSQIGKMHPASKENENSIFYQ